MNKKHVTVLYLAVAVGALFLLAGVIEKNPRVDKPAEYVYWEEETTKSDYNTSVSAAGDAASFSLPAGEKQYLASNPETPASSVPELPPDDKQTIGSEPSSVAASAVESNLNSETVNLNTSTVEQLCTLKGIGPVLAQRIIDYRSQNGDFATIEEIMEVSGIGEKKFAAIAEWITV